MNVIIAGGNGFLGKALQLALASSNANVTVLTRKPSKANDILWDGQSLGLWVEELNGIDVLINLVGRSVDCRYNQKNRNDILQSRIQSTRLLQTAVSSLPTPPKLWINSSSATIYMHAESILMKEKGGVLGDDFSTNVCKTWEQEFFKVQQSQIRKVALRTSIVLGNEGGAFPKLKLLSKLGLGGKIGAGFQKVSWIHIEDFCCAVKYIIHKESIQGVLNITAPTPISNNEFMEELRGVMRILFGFKTPKFLLEIGMLLFQSESELLLKSRNVYPELLLNNGFEFKYSSAKEAFKELC